RPPPAAKRFMLAITGTTSSSHAGRNLWATTAACQSSSPRPLIAASSLTRSTAHALTSLRRPSTGGPDVRWTPPPIFCPERHCRFSNVVGGGNLSATFEKGGLTNNTYLKVDGTINF